MKNTAPIGLGICAVAGLFGLVGGTMAFVTWDYSFLGALFLAAVIATIVAIVLWLGWRPANTNGRDMAAEAHRAGQAPTVPAAGSGGAVAAPKPAPAPAPMAETPSPAAKESGADKATSGAAATGPGAATAAPAEAEPPVDGPGEKPATLDAAREGGPDDLKQIKGVGPKMEGLLHSMGFYHFDQVAGWTANEVAWVDQNLEGFKGRVTRDDWVAQAKVLAAGGETEFSKKVDKGGVY